VTTTDICDKIVADESGTLVGLISATDIFMAVEETGWKDKS
jgi:CBS-domain-containing membrane protein